MKEIQLNPAFVKTRNVRNFVVLMEGLALGAGEGRLGKVIGQAGRGKTRTAQWFAAHNDCTYLRVIGPMVNSDTEFLESLCRELRITGIPRRQGAMFHAIVDNLCRDPRPVMLDELERVRPAMLDLVRDLSDTSTVPFVLIGEEELDTVMRRNRRIWSRTFQAIEFEPVGANDIIFYLKESAGLSPAADVAELMRERSSGDWRLIKSASINLVQQANANGSQELTTKMVNAAFTRAGIRG